MGNMKANPCKIKKPTEKVLYEVMEAICALPNPWAFCLPWMTEKPTLFNKFIDVYAWFKKDKSFLEHKTHTTEFMFHKKLKKDVLVSYVTPDEKGRICFWHPESHNWVHDKSGCFSAPKEKH